MNARSIAWTLAVLLCASGCSTVTKTVGTTLNIVGHATKTSLTVAKAGAGVAVDVSAHAVRAGVDLADHASRKPVVARTAAAYSGGPAVAALAAVAR